MKAIKFGRHSPTKGHIVFESRHGLYSRGHKKRMKVELVNERWIGDDGKDYTDDVERIEQEKQIKRLEALLA